MKLSFATLTGAMMTSWPMKLQNKLNFTFMLNSAVEENWEQFLEMCDKIEVNNSCIKEALLLKTSFKKLLEMSTSDMIHSKWMPIVPLKLGIATCGGGFSGYLMKDKEKLNIVIIDEDLSLNEDEEKWLINHELSHIERGDLIEDDKGFCGLPRQNYKKESRADSEGFNLIKDLNQWKPEEICGMYNNFITKLSEVQSHYIVSFLKDDIWEDVPLLGKQQQNRYNDKDIVKYRKQIQTSFLKGFTKRANLLKLDNGYIPNNYKFVVKDGKITYIKCDRKKERVIKTAVISTAAGVGITAGVIGMIKSIKR